VNRDFVGVLRTLEACSAVKEVSRKGWKKKAKISRPESVADHIYATTLASMMVGDLLSLNTEKMMRMALLHDVCEAVTGDIQPGEMEPSWKEKMETSALAAILRDLPGSVRAKYLAAFKDFNRGTSREAMIVRDLDKLEMVVQASSYERDGVRKDLLDEFWKTANERVKTVEGREMLSLASSLRPRRPAP
jgi:putative hydrolase of HD superfamily